MTLDSSVPSRRRAMSKASRRSSLRSLDPDGSSFWPGDVLSSGQLARGPLHAPGPMGDDLRSKDPAAVDGDTIQCSAEVGGGLPASLSLGSASDPLHTWLVQASTAPPPTDQHPFPSSSTTPNISSAVYDFDPVPPLRRSKPRPYHPSNPKKDRRSSRTHSHILSSSDTQPAHQAPSVHFPPSISHPTAIELPVHERRLSTGYGSPTGSHQSSLRSKGRRSHDAQDKSRVRKASKSTTTRSPVVSLASTAKPPFKTDSPAPVADHHSPTPQVEPAGARDDVHLPVLTTLASKPNHSTSIDLTLPTQNVHVPIKKWAEWMERMRWGSYILPCVVFASLVIKLLIGLWAYCYDISEVDYLKRSTYGPAERSLYNPPLATWLSFCLGKLATRIPWLAPYMAPDTHGKRTVLLVLDQLGIVLCDLLFYVPAIVYWCYARRLVGRPEPTPPSTPTSSVLSTYGGTLQRNVVLKGASAAAILTQPALTLLYQRHRQYSWCIVLGLSTWTFALLHSFLPNPPSLASDSSTTFRHAHRVYRAYRNKSTRWLSYHYLGATFTFSFAVLFQPSVLLYVPG